MYLNMADLAPNNSTYYKQEALRLDRQITALGSLNNEPSSTTPEESPRSRFCS